MRGLRPHHAGHSSAILHVHTARSQDASTQGTRVIAARGLPLRPRPGPRHPALRPRTDVAHAGSVQLARPLDFAADHRSRRANRRGPYLQHPRTRKGYGSLACQASTAAFPRVAFFLFNGRYSMLGSRWGFCGEDAEALPATAAGIVWKEHQTAAEEVLRPVRGLLRVHQPRRLRVDRRHLNTGRPSPSQRRLPQRTRTRTSRSA